MVIAIIPSVVDLLDLILFHHEGGLFREGLAGCWLLAGWLAGSLWCYSDADSGHINTPALVETLGKFSFAGDYWRGFRDRLLMPYIDIVALVMGVPTG